jgi:hypothetical protein
MWVAAVGVLILVSALGTASIGNEPSATAGGRTIGYLFHGFGGGGRHRNLAGTADLSTTAPGTHMRRTPGPPRTSTPPAPSVTSTTETPPTTLPPATRPSSGLSVHVDGNRLVNGSGQQMRLLGVDVTGTESACIQNLGLSVGASSTPAEDAASAAAITSWHMNAVRIPLNEDCWLDIDGAPAALSGASYSMLTASSQSLTCSGPLPEVINPMNNGRWLMRTTRLPSGLLWLLHSSPIRLSFSICSTNHTSGNLHQLPHPLVGQHQRPGDVGLWVVMSPAVRVTSRTKRRACNNL